MTEKTFLTGAAVPANTKLELTFEQAESRKASLIAEYPAVLSKAIEDLALAKKAVVAANAGSDTAERIKADGFLASARENLQKRRLYTTTAPVFFKAGEVVGIDRSGADFGRGLTEALGVEVEDRPASERAKARAPRPPRGSRSGGQK